MDGKLEYKVTINGVDVAITSFDELAKAIKNAHKAYMESPLGSESQAKNKAAYENLISLNERLSSQYGINTKSLQANQHASSQASIALLNLNYVIRDSPYFLQNFALGVLAVGNNINPLIDSFSNLRKEAIKVQTETGKTTTTMSLLKGALAGGAGISIAFSLAVTAIQSFVLWMSRSKEETEKNKEAIDLHAEALKKLGMSYRELQFEQQKVIGNIDSEALLSEKLLLERKLEGFVAEHPEFGRMGYEPLKGEEKTRAEKRIGEIENLLKGYTTSIQLTTQQQTVFNIEIDKGVKSFLSYIKENQRTQEELEAVRRSLNSSRSEVGYLSDDYNRFTKRIEILDEVLGKHKDKIRSVTADIINYNEALRMMDEELKAIDEQLEEAIVPKTMTWLDEALTKRGGKEAPFNITISDDEIDLKRADEEINAQQEAHIDEQTKKLTDKQRLINQLSSQLGNTLSQAFIQGNVSLRSLIKSMEAFIAQLIIVQTVKGIFTSIFTPGGTFMSGFSTFANGGYLPRAEQGMIVPGVHTSGDSILARVNSGEMILNQRQQSTLFNMINKGGGGQQLVNVRVEGQIESRHDKFVIDFQRAKKRMEFKTYTGGL